MVSKVLSSIVVGLDGVMIEVETDILNDLASLSIVRLSDKAVEESKVIRKSVEKALSHQRKRFLGKKEIMNSEMSSRDLKQFLKIEDDVREIMKNAMKTLSLSARSFNKVLKVSRTIADLEAIITVKVEHVLKHCNIDPKQ